MPALLADDAAFQRIEHQAQAARHARRSHSLCPLRPAVLNTQQLWLKQAEKRVGLLSPFAASTPGDEHSQPPVVVEQELVLRRPQWSLVMTEEQRKALPEG